MNNDMVKGKWTEIKGELQNMWGKLTHDELDRTEGNAKAISGLVRQHYSDTKEDVSAKVNDVFHRAGKAVADKSEEIKNDMQNKRDSKY